MGGTNRPLRYLELVDQVAMDHLDAFDREQAQRTAQMRARRGEGY